MGEESTGLPKRILVEWQPTKHQVGARLQMSCSETWGQQQFPWGGWFLPLRLERSFLDVANKSAYHAASKDMYVKGIQRGQGSPQVSNLTGWGYKAKEHPSEGGGGHAREQGQPWEVTAFWAALVAFHLSCSGGGQRWFKTKKSLVGAEFQNTWSSNVYRGDSLKARVLLMIDFQEAAFVGTEFLPAFQSLTFKYFFDISRAKVKNWPHGVHTLNME